MSSDPAFQAAQRLEALGNFEDAYRGYVKLGRKSDAARVAVRLGRPGEAAKLFAECGMPYESAGLYYQLGMVAEALDQLVFVPRDHAQYRPACVYAIHFASQLDRLDFGLENLLTDFSASRPANEPELNAFLTLVALYERQGMADNAIDALDRVLDVVPQHRDALASKTRLGQHATRAVETAAKNLAADDAFFGRVAEKRAPAALPMPAGDARATQLGTPVASPPPPAGAAPAPSPVAGSPPSPGAASPAIVVAGRYRLESKIGIGGMAEVWRATDLDVGEEIALKLFQPLADPTAEERIKAELRLTRRLAHPNVARVYDIGTHEGRRYISMELLKGRDLQGVAKPVAPPQAIDWLAQACEGLHSAHEQGVIHRDVKPENLFLTEQGKVKVMDFGIAKDTEVRRTRAGMMAGTPEFMSPEQINDMSQVTAATDIYSLGIVAYELLTGTIPFSHKELMPLLMMHAKDPPPPMRSRRPDLPPALDAAVLQALEKQPANRPATARRFAEMLKAALQ